MSVVADASEVIRYRGLIKQLVVRDLKLRYERSVLGFVWTLLNPLLMIGIYTFIFSVVLRQGIPNFPVFLVPVLLPWNFLVRCLSGVSPMIYQSGYLLNRAAFPSESLTFSGMLSAFVDFCIEMSIFMVVLAIMGSPIFPGLLVIPAVMLIHLLFVAGIVLLFSVGYVFYRDMQYIVPIFSLAWFFLTPVFYSADMVPQQYQWIYAINPMVHIAGCFRDPLYTGMLPPPNAFATAALIGVGTFAIGWIFYARHKRAFPELI